MSKKISILGSTGSIGKQALDIISKADDRFEVVAISCNSNVDLLAKQANIFKPKYVVIYNPILKEKLSSLINDERIQILTGMEGLVYISTLEELDMLLTAVVGNIGLRPTYEAVKLGKNIALANKETLVTAGKLIMELAEKTGSKIIPVDSEHSAIYQSIANNKRSEIEKILLTASGGPFRKFSKEEIVSVKARQALKHPNWSMGNKITIDSATLMNKGLELIEAKWLFGIEPKNIDVIVHPESIIHSMVQYRDSSVIGQMGLPDMRLPIIYALDYPERQFNQLERMDFTKIATLNFEKPDLERFPCLRIAIDAIETGGTVPTVMNAANEELVYKFLKDEISFYDISETIDKLISKHKVIQNPSIDDILELDLLIREEL